MKEYMRVKGRRGVYNEYVVCECECEKAEGDTECKEEQRIWFIVRGLGLRCVWWCLDCGLRTAECGRRDA